MSKIIKMILDQCRKPSGVFGWLTAKEMNVGHARLTGWGLEFVRIEEDFTVLDIGCGGGGTVHKLARLSPRGQVYGIDYSDQCVAVASAVNRRAIQRGQVDIRHGSVSDLPYSAGFFDLVTAIETHYFWPDLSADLREVRRVLKSGGKLLILGEAYKGSKFDESNAKWEEAGNMTFLSPDDLCRLLSGAGFVDVQINLMEDQGWICCIAKKP